MSKESKKDAPRDEKPYARTPIGNTDIIPDSVAHLAPSPIQRDLAKIIASMSVDEDFRTKFWKDPAAALIEKNIVIDHNVCDMLFKDVDRTIIDNIVKDAQAVMSRSNAFTWEGERVAVVPLIAAFLLGALVAEALHHHIVE